MIADATPIAGDKSRAELDALTHVIIGCAHRVSSGLGMGFLEKVYENALRIELRKAGLNVDQQTPVDVSYGGEVVGEYITDLIVDSSVIVEVKAAERSSGAHRAQCVHYLRATGFRVCLLLNFGASRLETNRFVLNF